MIASLPLFDSWLGQVQQINVDWGTMLSPTLFELD